MRISLRLLTLYVVSAALPVSAAGLADYGCVGEAEANAATGVRATALRAMRKGDNVSALPLLEAAARQEPDDVAIQRCLGVALLSQASFAKDAAAAKDFDKRAHAAFLKARALGDQGDIVQLGIESTGGEIEFDDSALAAILREAEAAFARGDYRAALAQYQRALQADPKRYEAALYAGDACYQLHDAGCAGEWYAKAIAIDPKRETAYRYWGDALIGAGQNIAARDKFIDAIIAEPYNRSSYKGLGQWANGLHITLSAPRIEIPVSGKDQTLTVGRNLQSYWLAYGVGHLAGVKQDDALQTELKALRAAIQVAAEQGIKDPGEKDPALATLIRLDRKGLLEAHVLFHRADQAIAEQYAAYREAHREQLRRYWIEEVIRLPPS
jgi:tetratricopeptide (TPR) repeat protein